jgi:hypothetical protein
MSTAKFNTWQNPDGTENYKCRAWVNFNGTGTVAIRAAGNVTSITDNGAGDYTVNFTTAIVDNGYAAVVSCTQRSSGSSSSNSIGYHSTDNVNAITYGTTQIRIQAKTSAGDTLDLGNISLAIFR